MWVKPSHIANLESVANTRITKKQEKYYSLIDDNCIKCKLIFKKLKVKLTKIVDYDKAGYLITCFTL